MHDNSSYGRKTPSQLVIDAFIKGILEEFPKAHLTFDRFHVMQLMNDAVDEVVALVDAQPEANRRAARKTA